MKLRKNILCAVLALALAAMSLAGCSLFSTEGEGGDTETGSDPIKMTDSYTFEDPADLEYAKRYVIYCDENSAAVAQAKDYGVTAMYSILYADENDQPLGYNEYMVCGTEENAKAVMEVYANFGSPLTACEADPTVLFSSSDGDSFAGALVAFQSQGVISEATVSAFVEYYAESSGGTVQ